MADTLRIVGTTSLQVDCLSQEMRASRIEMNKRWGDLSASLGLLVENIVAPSVPRALSKVFACPDKAVEFLGACIKRRHPSLPGRNREFDAVAVGCGYVLIVESKVQLDSRAVAEFAERLPEAREYFPFTPKTYQARRTFSAPLRDCPALAASALAELCAGLVAQIGRMLARWASCNRKLASSTRATRCAR